MARGTGTTPNQQPHSAWSNTSLAQGLLGASAIKKKMNVDLKSLRILLPWRTQEPKAAETRGPEEFPDVIPRRSYKQKELN